MKTPEMSFPKKEEKNSCKIEHFDGFDVVVNLDYPETEDQEMILSILREKGEKDEDGSPKAQVIVTRDIFKKFHRIFDIKTEEGTPRFYTKIKAGKAQELVDFALGRTNNNPLSRMTARSVEDGAYYAFASVVNEVVISKKVKEIVASEAFQALVRKHGFSGISFAEPIVAIVEKSSKRYLIYRNIEESMSLKRDYFTLHKIAAEASDIFLERGITPNDLRWNQFIIVDDGDKRHLVLIDIEAYTEKK